MKIPKDQKSVEISGWAHGCGETGSQATQVEVSTDGGKTWTYAHEYLLEKREPGKNCYSWTLWKYKLAISEADSQAFNVLVRATDNNGKMQVGDIKTDFNLRGIMNAAPHEIDFTVTRE